MEVKIYQIKDSKFDTCMYVFRGCDFAKKHGLILEDYEEVYSYLHILTPNSENGYSCVISNKDKRRVLESIFNKFNTNRPEDFKGHSLSVSDIVSLDGEYYYCDDFGWEKI